MKIKTITAVCAVIMLTSCKTSNQVTYFQDLGLNSSSQTMEQSVNYEAKIIPDDLLTITVSSIDPSAVAAFNLPMASFLDVSDPKDGGIPKLAATPMLQTYLVDGQGDINFPIIGKLHVAGLTRSQLISLLENKISTYAKSPLVSVRIQNFKISVLGEVTVPGMKTVVNERISILDAIGMAGDLTIYGERTNVLLIRDNNGKKEFHRFDLTSSEVLSSPYYYLQQNDIVYVEPNKARKGNSQYSQSAQFNISVASTIVSAISVLASLTIALLVK